MPLKTLHLSIFCLFAALAANAQNNYFEGQVTYSRTAHSTSALSDKEIADYLLPGNSSVATIKNGSCYKHAAGYEEWITTKDKRTYYRFPKLDTLYYSDFDSDTTTLLEMKTGEAPFAILGHPCKSILLKTYGVERLLYYATDLRVDAKYDKDITIEKYNRCLQELNGGILLWKKTTFSTYGYGVDSATGIKATAVDDHIFDRPELPLKKYNEKELIASPTFPGGGQTWIRYLQHNLNADIGAKYIKLGRKETQGEVKVLVAFAVETNGTLSDITVVSDTKGIHPKIVDEAVRVIRESPRWISGSAFGEKCKMHNFQRITFQVARE